MTVETRSGLIAREVTDADEWNAFVDGARYATFPQLWEWGELRRAVGWRPIRLVVGEGDAGGRPVAGAQLILRRVPVVGWALAYAPRGPIGTLDEPEIRDALVAALRRLGGREGIATLKVDPEVEPQTAAGAALLAAPWRGARLLQPPRTRVIDLHADEDALRAEMHRKHRQYVSKAERAGVRVERFDGTAPPEVIGPALADFNRIYRLTADRAGFLIREAAYYERVWATFAPGRRVRLSFATLDGERVATLFHFTCGPRAIETYGGMTDAGAESRANYLVKWRAICDFRAEGFAVYDMWGIATGGIAKFKAGFGGRELEYVGLRDLPLQPAADALLRVALPGHQLAQRAWRRLSGRSAGARRTAPVDGD